MNGNGSFGAEDFIPSTSSTGGFTPQSQEGATFLGTLQNLFNRATSLPVDTTSGVSGALYNAIYAFGAGRIDLARERAAQALLASSSGQKFVGAVERERIKQLAPMFIIGAVVLFGIAFALGRR